METNEIRGNVDAERWYSARDASYHLEVTEQTVTEWCRRGVIKECRKIGSKMKWHVLGSEILRIREERGLNVPRA